MLFNKCLHLTCLLGIFSVLVVQSQSRFCYSDEIVEKLRSQDAQYDFELRQLENGHEIATQRSGGTVFTIPVVVHVILNTSSKLNSVSDIRINQQLQTLNDDFRLVNADASQIRSIFKGIAADVEIEFCLARQDPNGNQTDGITRTLTNSLDWDYDTEGDDMKFSSFGGHDAWDPYNYLNIWIVDIAPAQTAGGGTIAGYAYRGSSSIHGASVDGIVIDYQIGFGSTNRVLTHEVGHYLGLQHPWGSGGCFNDDGISDTPRTTDENYGCDTLQNSCTNESPDLPDLVENHMDYTSCRVMFTLGQKSRMRNILIGSRFSLTTSLGCQSIANFVSTEATGCDYLVVAFTDQSLYNPVAWNWSFPGGDPVSSTQPNPTVIYSNNGTFNVVLSVTNSSGTFTATFYDYVNILSNPVSNISGTNAVCTGVNNGDIQLTATGGNPPYTYLWSNGWTDQNLSQASPGAYHVTITDDNNCTAANSIVIGQDIQLEIISVSNPDSAATGMGTLSVSVLNGDFPVNYIWDDPDNSTTPSIKGLLAGRYTVTATDANGCQIVKSFDIVDRQPVATSVKEALFFSELKIYPNPASEKVTIEITCTQPEAISLGIFNSIGVLTEETSFTKTSYIIYSYNLNNFSPGIYYLRITGATGSVARRLIVFHD